MYLLVYPGFLSPLPLKFLWNIALRPPMGWTHLSDTTDKRTCLCPFVCLSVCFLDGVWHGTNIHHYKPGFIYNALLGETPPVLSRIQHKTDDDDDDDDALALFIYICCYLLKNAIGYLIVFRKEWGAKAFPAGKFSRKKNGWKGKKPVWGKVTRFSLPHKNRSAFYKSQYHIWQFNQHHHYHHQQLFQLHPAQEKRTVHRR